MAKQSGNDDGSEDDNAELNGFECPADVFVQ